MDEWMENKSEWTADRNNFTAHFWTNWFIEFKYLFKLILDNGLLKLPLFMWHNQNFSFVNIVNSELIERTVSSTSPNFLINHQSNMTPDHFIPFDFELLNQENSGHELLHCKFVLSPEFCFAGFFNESQFRVCVTWQFNKYGHHFDRINYFYFWWVSAIKSSACLTQNQLSPNTIFITKSHFSKIETSPVEFKSNELLYSVA